MHHPLTDIQADLRLIGLLDIKLPQKEIIGTDGQTDRRHARQQNVVFFSKKKENNTDIEKKILKINYFSHASS